MREPTKNTSNGYDDLERTCTNFALGLNKMHVDNKSVINNVQMSHVKLQKEKRVRSP